MTSDRLTIYEQMQFSQLYNKGFNWNNFIKENGGNYCQLLNWKEIIFKTYQLEPLYLVIANEHLEALGVFSAMRLPWPLHSKAVSMPYCNYGGFAFKSNISSSAKSICIDYLGANGIHFLETRELGDGGSSSEVAMYRNLPETEGQLWSSVGDKLRNQIRKSQKYGFEICWGRNQVDSLYEVYAINMGRLGTPVHSKLFIQNIVDSFQENCNILTISHLGEVISAMLVIKFGSIWADPIASSKFEFRSQNVNMLLYWEAFKAGIKEGVSMFDLGRSSRFSGTYNFKRQWGSYELPIRCGMYVDGIFTNSSSVNFYRGSIAKFSSKIWNKLPFQVQKNFGPIIRRYMP